jgi:hypothetical protein
MFLELKVIAGAAARLRADGMASPSRQSQWVASTGKSGAFSPRLYPRQLPQFNGETLDLSGDVLSD